MIRFHSRHRIEFSSESSLKNCQIYLNLGNRRLEIGVNNR